MSAPDRPLLLEQPFTRANPRLEGAWSHSFDVPEEWNLPRGFRDGVRVFEAVANDDLGAGILEATASARAWKGPAALAIVGQRIAVVRDGHAIANVRRATSASLVEAIRVGLRRVPAIVERELDGEPPVSILEQLAALDLVDDVSPDDPSVEELRDARAWVFSGGAGRRGGLFMRLIDDALDVCEIDAKVAAGMSMSEALGLTDAIGDLVPPLEGDIETSPFVVHGADGKRIEADVWRCRECTFRGPLERFDRDGGFACPTCSSRRVTSGP